MKFEKGQSGNPSGRPKGSRNKATNDLRSRISVFLESEFSSIKKAYASLSAEKKLKFFVDLLSYTVPKLSNTKMEVEFENMTNDQLAIVISELKKEAQQQVETEKEQAILSERSSNTDFDQLSDEQLNVIINELINHSYEQETNG